MPSADNSDVAAESPAAVRVESRPLAYFYDAELPPVLEVDSGAVLVFETVDARDGSLAHHPTGSLFSLPRPDPGRGNPLTGPVAVTGTEPGDALVVDILAVECGPAAWAGGHAHANPLIPGRIPESLGRSCQVTSEFVDYGAGIKLPASPMVGCIGTAPKDSKPSAGQPGRHGGNIDQPIVRAGTRVFLPVEVPGGLLFLGDVHAAQGDGELSGTAFEVPADVTVRVSVTKGLSLVWPWILTDDRLAVMTSGVDFVEARYEAVEAMLSLIERCLGLDPADGLALISVAGDLRVGQAYGGMDMTLRLEMPLLPGLELVPGMAHSK